MFDFIVANLAIIICVLAGLGLLVVEMFVPGFGVPGVSGIVLLIVSAVLLGFKSGPLAAVGLIVIIVALVAIMLSIAIKSAANGRLSQSKLILHESESSQEGFLSSSDMSVFLGREASQRHRRVRRRAAQRCLRRHVHRAGRAGQNRPRGRQPHSGSYGPIKSFNERKGLTQWELKWLLCS